MSSVQLRRLSTRHDHASHEDSRTLRAERSTAKEGDEDQDGEGEGREQAGRAVEAGRPKPHQQQQRHLNVQPEQSGEHQRASNEDPGEFDGQRRPHTKRNVESQAGD